MVYRRFEHNIVNATIGIKAHAQPVTGLALLPGPKLLSGSCENSIKVINR